MIIYYHGISARERCHQVAPERAAVQHSQDYAAWPCRPVLQRIGIRKHSSSRQEGITMAARILLTNARLFDSIAGSILERTAVLINGERIESVTIGESRTPEGAEVIDLG